MRIYSEKMMEEVNSPMEKAGSRTRDITYFSPKNDRPVCVHSQAARRYADRLEQDPTITQYEANTKWDQPALLHLSHVDIRKDYFGTSWTSDFLIRYQDGSFGVREIIRKSSLANRAACERLELSRRYWAFQGCKNW